MYRSHPVPGRPISCSAYPVQVPLLIPAIVLFVVLVFIALIPFSLVQRFRAGTARRVARGWVATTNAAVTGMSAALVLTSAALMNVWVPDAFRFALTGLAAGLALGAIGLRVSRWESAPEALHYTPNRWLVLGITALVTSRLIYGVWRGWESWRDRLDDTSWLAASGAAGSVAAGAVVLGYYLAYWIGVRRRVQRHRRNLL
jgi:hypothetical protein